MSPRTSRRYRPKRWTLASALAYAETHARGCNVDAVGAKRAAQGNVPGAIRLRAWALARVGA